MISKQALGNTLFEMANILRDKVEDYKSYFLVLLFFKRLSDNYHWEIEEGIKNFNKEYGKEPNAKQRQKIIDKAHDFDIPFKCFWKDVRDATESKKNETLHKAVTGIGNANQHIQALKGIFNTVKWNEPSPDGSGGKKLSPVVLTQLISYLDAVDLSNKNVTVDVLGDAYEYLIKKFADENKGGTTAGQFYTPQEVVDIIVRYTKPKKDERVYDPTCGSGGFLINSAKYVKEFFGSQKAIQLFGQDDKWNAWAICNINMILHGLDAKVKKEDTLLNPQFNDGKNIDKFDLVLANFPFSFDNWWKNGKPKKDKKGNAVLTKDGKPQLIYPDKNEFSDPWDRFEYGTPPFSVGDFAFLQHIIASLNENGRAGVVCPQGVLFRGQPEKTEEEDGQNRKADDEYEIRRKFLTGLEDDNGKKIDKRNIIEAIVVLPSNLFYGTTIPGSIVFFNKNKPAHRKNKVLMVFAAREGWYKEESNMNTLLPHDILRIMTMLESWGDIDVAKKFIPTQEIRLHKKIQDDFDYKLSEIEIHFREDIDLAEWKVAELKKKNNPTKGQKKDLKKKEEALQKLLDKKNSQIFDATAFAVKEKLGIENVKQELIQMFSDPELRKRYFSIVEMEELEENDYNLNMPRYVDAFEPEEEIDLKEAIEDFNSVLQSEEQTENSLSELLSSLT
jgi:type I restriction enzyme M protein